MNPLLVCGLSDHLFNKGMTRSGSQGKSQNTPAQLSHVSNKRIVKIPYLEKYLKKKKI